MDFAYISRVQSKPHSCKRDATRNVRCQKNLRIAIRLIMHMLNMKKINDKIVSYNMNVKDLHSQTVFLLSLFKSSRCQSLEDFYFLDN